MSQNNFLIFALINLVILFKNSSCLETCNAPSKLIQTLNGKIAGECHKTPIYYTYTNITNIDILSWLSVPYAQPPINQNRFKNPIPVNSWSYTRDGTLPPKSCLQLETDLNETSEDCLYLNIYVQANSFANRETSQKPILVFIHGGSYTIGSSTDYEPSTLVAMSDIIVVTINYRLNALGFMHVSGTEANGNQGLLDTTMALKWIWENAKTFGGDNTRISISGESAGAWSVGFLLYYPKSWPYFRNGIMQSGGPTGINNNYKLLTSREATKRADTFFWFLGCYSWINQWSLNCAKQKSESQILVAYKKVDDYMINWKGKYEPELYLPVIDNNVYEKSIPELTEENAFKNCSIMTGYNANEASLFVLYGYNILGSDYDKAASVAKTFDLKKFLKGLKKYLKYFPRYPYKDKKIVAEVYKEYFNSADTQIQYSDAKSLLMKLSKIASDFQYNCQATQLASFYSKKGLKAYVYEFAYDLESTSIPDDLLEYFPGPTHGDELAITFASVLTEDYIEYTNELEMEFAQKIVTYWTNFVKYNDPSYGQDSSDSGFWKPFLNGESGQQGDLSSFGRRIQFRNNGSTMITGYTENHCKFWKFD